MNVGPDSVVGIGTRYVLYRPGIESRWWLRFPRTFTSAMGPAQPSVQRQPCRFLRAKRLQRGVDHSAQSSAEVTERVDRYLHYPYGPLWPALGWTLPLPLFLA